MREPPYYLQETISMSTITKVSSCSTTACSFNAEGGCHAHAITVGGENAAACTTFATIDVRAGVAGADSEVGACHRLDCVHNRDLTCAAGDIDIVGATADCASYTAR